MEGHGQFESDKQNILPPQYTYSGYNHVSYNGQQPVPTQTVIHINSVPSPPDYFLFSLLVTIFCCLPFGIVALVKSSEVRTRAHMGDVTGAEMSSSQAKKWSYAGLFTGIGIVTCVVIFYVILFCAVINNTGY